MIDVVDLIEWTATATNAFGVLFGTLILLRLYDYRHAVQAELARNPNNNGRRSHFAAVLIRFGRLTFVIQALFLWASVASLMRSNTGTEATGGAAFFIALSLIFDLVWVFTLRDFDAIANYRSRTADA